MRKNAFIVFFAAQITLCRFFISSDSEGRSCLSFSGTIFPRKSGISSSAGFSRSSSASTFPSVLIIPFSVSSATPAASISTVSAALTSLSPSSRSAILSDAPAANPTPRTLWSRSETSKSAAGTSARSQGRARSKARSRSSPSQGKSSAQVQISCAAALSSRAPRLTLFRGSRQRGSSF